MFEEIHTKKCPFCAETIKLEAIKCRFCGEKLDLADVTQQVADRKAKEDIFKNRALCSDGNCVGVIGPDGKCKVCGKPFEQNEDCNIIDVPLERKTNKIKAVIFLTVALFFFAYTIYSGGSIGSFFALIIGLVCGLIGVLNLRGN